MSLAQINERTSETGYKCPACGGSCSVIDSRPSEHGWRRRRGCRCGFRFTTYEVQIDPSKSFVDELGTVSNTLAHARDILNGLDLMVRSMSARAEQMQRLHTQSLGNPGARRRYER